jgi:hypothetical protein
MRVRLLAASLILLPASLQAQRSIIGLPFEVRVPKPPTAVAADGKMWLNYELHITNLFPRDMGIKSVTVLEDGSGRVLQALDPAAIGKGIQRVGSASRDSINSPIIGAGRRSVLFLWIPIESGSAVPAGVSHRIIAARADSLETAMPDTLVTTGVPVSRVAPVLAAPFHGGPWMAVNGPGNTSGHRRTMVPIAGTARIAQRFATDWIKLGPDGRAWKGDSSSNANWYGYNEPLYAVGDGRVTATKDGIAENVPLSPTRAVAIDLETVGGNHVIIDLGGGQYAFYAHLVPGSVAVKVWDHVKKGQLIGRLGNSGNSDAPHLHFHLGDANLPLGSEGIPWVFERFERLDKLTSMMTAMTGWKNPGTPSARTRELPLENEVVNFP